MTPEEAKAVLDSLTMNQRNMLEALDEKFQTPLFMGGANGSHHSATLKSLALKGLAERHKWCNCLLRRPPWPYCRCKGSCQYKITASGKELQEFMLQELLTKREARG